MPRRKSIALGIHCRRQNECKIVRNGGPKTHRKSIAFWNKFLRIFAQFWGPRAAQKSLKIGLVSYLGRKPELEGLRGSNLNVLGVIRERFWTIPGRFSHDFGAATSTNPLLARYFHNAMLREICMTTASEELSFEKLPNLIRATRSRSIDR